MPKFKLSILAAAVSLSAGSFTQSGGYQNGVEAFLQGDYVHAAGHYNEAATGGNARVQNNLAAMYYMGQGVTEDAVSAHMWADLAHENGIASAEKFQTVFAAGMSNAEVNLAVALAQECMHSGYSHCGLKAYVLK